jgi:hypothetical protein
MTTRLPIALPVQPGLILFATALATTLAQWRHWYNALDMKMLDGSPDPRAGKFSPVKMIADLAVIPSIIVAGAVMLGLGFQMAVAVGVVGAIGFLGAAFVVTGAEKLRDLAITALVTRLGGWR